MEFRYNAAARDMEDALVEDLKVEPKTAAEPEVQEWGLERIAVAKSAGEEIDAMIEGYATDDIKQHETRKKLAGILARGRNAVVEFLK